MVNAKEAQSPWSGKQTCSSHINASAAAKTEYRIALDTWLERKDTCVSAIHEAVEGIPDALEIADQYILEKDILPQDDPDKEVLASELLERLVLRFRGEIQDELGDLNKKFTDFVIKSEEKVCTGIDRLNGIVQKLTQHDQPPIEAAKLSKLKTALEKVPSLNQLWLTVSLSAYMTYDEVVATCRRYDNAMDLQRSITSGEQVHYNTVTNPADRVVCSYPKCRKAGHTQADCWKKKRDQQTAQLKRAGRSKSFRDETWKKSLNKLVKQSPGDSSYTGL